MNIGDWASVGDEMPAEGVDVLVAIVTGPAEFDWDMAVMHRYQHWCWRGYEREIKDDDDSYPQQRVTHWAQIPSTLHEMLAC